MGVQGRREQCSVNEPSGQVYSVVSCLLFATWRDLINWKESDAA